MTPYRDAADALARAHRQAITDRRPYAERYLLDHAAQVCARIADEEGEEET